MDLSGRRLSVVDRVLSNGMVLDGVPVEGVPVEGALNGVLVVGVDRPRVGSG